MSMAFQWGNHKYIIIANSVVPTTKVSVQGLEHEMHGGGELFAVLATGSSMTEKSSQPKELQNLLQEFHHVLEEPKGIPPSRAFDHRIPLKEGTVPVNVRPDQYANF